MRATPLRSTMMAILLLGAAANSLAAEIYTFGRGANGARYVKHVERPLAERKATREAEAGDKAVTTGKPRPPAGNRGRTGNAPPPPIDPKALEVLNTPIM